MVQDTARSFVAHHMTISAFRTLRDAGPSEGFDRAVWAKMTALGWPGMAIAEEYGGSGLGIRALAAVIEEMGKTLGASPLASTALVAATLIGRFADACTRAHWLPQIAEGKSLAALAVEEGPRASQGLPSTVLRNGVITGAKRYVADGAAADLLLVSAADGEADVIAAVRTNDPQVKIDRRASIDGLSLCDVRFEKSPVEFVVTCSGIVDYAQDCARLGLCAEMLGACSQAFEVTLDYLRVREQFGRPIGSFQSLQHRAAILFIEFELARSCVHAAADALHHDTPELAKLISLAKATTGELMRLMAYEMIQLHGGIGMTDAHDSGLYLKRGRVAALLHGDSAFHRDRFAKLQGY